MILQAITIRNIQKEDRELFKTIRLKALKDSPNSSRNTYEIENQQTDIQ